MQITITLLPDQVEALESFRRQQTKLVTHPQTGQQFTDFIYPTVPAMIERHVAGLVQGAIQQFPPAALVAQHEQIKALQQQLADASVPTVAVAGE